MVEKATELRLDILEKKQDRIESIIDGNGKMGLKTKVTLLFWGHWPLGIIIGAMLKNYLEKLLG